MCLDRAVVVLGGLLIVVPSGCRVLNLLPLCCAITQSMFDAAFRLGTRDFLMYFSHRQL